MRGPCLGRPSGSVLGRGRGLDQGLCDGGGVRWLGNVGLGWVGLESEYGRLACARFGGFGGCGWIGGQRRGLLSLCSLSVWADGLQRSVEERGDRRSCLRLVCGACGGDVHGSGVGWAFWMLLRMLEKLGHARPDSVG
jgi:hypothetical protein